MIRALAAIGISLGLAELAYRFGRQVGREQGAAAAEEARRRCPEDPGHRLPALPSWKAVGPDGQRFTASQPRREDGRYS